MWNGKGIWIASNCKSSHIWSINRLRWLLWWTIKSQFIVCDSVRSSDITNQGLYLQVAREILISQVIWSSNSPIEQYLVKRFLVSPSCLSLKLLLTCKLPSCFILRLIPSLSIKLLSCMCLSLFCTFDNTIFLITMKDRQFT